jgi:hypothetical protein
MRLPSDLHAARQIPARRHDSTGWCPPQLHTMLTVLTQTPHSFQPKN